MSNYFYVAQCPILSDLLSSDQLTLGTMKLDVSMLLILLSTYVLLRNYALAVISWRCCEVPEIILASQNYNWFLLGHHKHYRCVFYHLVLGKLFLIALIKTYIYTHTRIHTYNILAFRTVMLGRKIKFVCFFVDGKIRGI